MIRPLEKATTDKAPLRRRGAKGLLVGSLVAQLCALLRYTLLARLLGPDQLGLAVTIILTSQFFESISDAGADRFLVQDKEGDAPRVQKLLHLVAIGRGLFIAAGLMIFAVPIASFYKAPQLTLGFVVLALAPFIMGFLHLDMRRVQRHHDFRVEGQATLWAEVASLIVTSLCAWLIGNYTAILYGLITRSVVMVAISHWKAQRPYRAGPSPQDLRRLSIFAWPLMINGLLLFMGSQGDRVMIANQVGLRELALYSSALLLIYYPTGALQKFVSAMHLPVIAGSRDDPAPYDRACNSFAAQILLLTLAMSAGFALVAPFMVPILYGRQFALPVFLIAAIGVLQASRFIRIWPVTIAMAQGQSHIVLLNNAARLIAFPAAIVTLHYLDDLNGVIFAFTLAEALALLVGVWLVGRLHGHPWQGFDRVMLYFASSAAILITAWGFSFDHPVMLGLGLVLATMCGSVLLWREWGTIHAGWRLLLGMRR